MGEKGFTLVELLVVIVVFSLLLTLAIPNVNKAFSSMANSLNEKFETTLKDTGEFLAIDVDDYMSDIYNCKGWINSYCTKIDNSWSKIEIPISALKEKKYLTGDVPRCASGELIIINNGNGEYDVTISNATCKN